MEKDTAKMRFSLRMEKELWEKFSSIVSYYGRSKNSELQQMIKRRILAFEKEHGKILL